MGCAGAEILSNHASFAGGDEEGGDEEEGEEEGEEEEEGGDEGEGWCLSRRLIAI